MVDARQKSVEKLERLLGELFGILMSYEGQNYRSGDEVEANLDFLGQDGGLSSCACFPLLILRKVVVFLTG